MEKADTAYMNYFIKKYQQSDSSYAGFMAVTGNRIIACEVFALPQYTQLFYKEMISSFVHALTARDISASFNMQAIKKFADNLFGSEALQKQMLQLHGKADKVNNKTIHLIAYGD